MSGLLSLPTELLQEIGAEAADKTLRLVCKRINLALEPQILSGIVLAFKRLASQVESLATTEPKPTSASKYATKLRIGPLWPEAFRQKGATPLEEVKIRSFLLPAIGSLVGVRRVVWDLGQSDPEWVNPLVVDALASLPVLEDLHLRVYKYRDPPVLFPGRQLSNLKKLTLETGCVYRASIIRTVAGLIGRNQPELTSLIIYECAFDGDPPTFQAFLTETSSSNCLKITHLTLSGLYLTFDASALRHLRSLISLTIRIISSPFGETIEDQSPEFLAERIWSTLRSEKIHLQELVTDAVQPALVEYLTTFSGLRRLKLITTTLCGTSLWVSNQTAIHFYEQGLENHISSLESLQVLSSYQGQGTEWCFGNHCSNAIKKGARLTLLELPINSEDIPRGEEEIRDDAESPSLTTENPIWSLLDICATLPILKCLRIQIAPYDNNLMKVWIPQNLERYGPITPNHVFHVSTPGSGTEYAVRRDDLGANLGYRPIARIQED